jgi:hypothetical protein
MKGMMDDGKDLSTRQDTRRTSQPICTADLVSSVLALLPCVFKPFNNAEGFAGGGWKNWG